MDIIKYQTNVHKKGWNYTQTSNHILILPTFYIYGQFSHQIKIKLKKKLIFNFENMLKWCLECF